MKTDKKTVGRKGEDEAAAFLEAEGQMILARNWRGGHTEIDIITMDRLGVHFVEVKSRTAPTAADPETGVDRAKQRHLVTAAGRFLRQAGGRLGDMEAFFDVVTVIFDRETTYLEYYPQAFIPYYG